MRNTDAHRNFLANLDELTAMIGLLMPLEATSVIKTARTRIHRQLRKNTAANIKVIESAVADLSAAVEKYLSGRQMVLDLTAVVLVTFVHAYLEDGLVLIATKDRSLLKTADAMDTDRVFESTSIDELRAEIRRQWANKTLTGGPDKWLPRLHAMGARGIKPDSAFRLRHLWATRNLIVHHRKIATTAYAKHDKRPSVKAGERVRVNTGLMLWWVQGAVDLVEPLDQFFLKYGEKRSQP